MKEIVGRIALGLLFIYLCGYKSVIVIGEVFTLGYLTGSQRRAGNLEYQKPGLLNLWMIFDYVTKFDSIRISNVISNSSEESVLC